MNTFKSYFLSGLLTYLRHVRLNWFKSSLIKVYLAHSKRKKILFRVNDIKFSLNLKNWIDQNVFFLGSYEQKEVNYFRSHLTSKSVFLDIGANIGIFTLNAAKENAQIYAFEPSSKNITSLKKNIKLNNAKHIQIIEKAASNENSIKTLYTYPENTGSNSLHQHGITQNTERVKTTTLDSFLLKQKLKKVDFIKMDIEGHELEALEGGRKLIKSFHPICLIEINKPLLSKAKHKPVEIYSLMKKYGYEPYRLTKDFKTERISKREFLKITQENIVFK